MNDDIEMSDVLKTTFLKGVKSTSGMRTDEPKQRENFLRNLPMSPCWEKDCRPHWHASISLCIYRNATNFIYVHVCTCRYKSRALREDPATCPKSRQELLQSGAGGESYPNHEPGCSARYVKRHTHTHTPSTSHLHVLTLLYFI